MKKRDKRKREKAGKTRRDLNCKRKRYEAVLEMLGLAVGYRRHLSEREKLRMLSFCKPPPQVEIDSSAQDQAAAESIATELREELEKPWPSEDSSISYADMIRTVTALPEAFRWLTGQVCDSQGRDYVDKAGLVLTSNYVPLCVEQMQSMVAHLGNVVATHSRIDRGIFGCAQSFAPPSSPNAGALRVTLGWNPPEVTGVSLDKHSRIAYRCGLSVVAAGRDPDPGWLEWPAMVLGLRNTGPTYPVYVQSHAIRRLYERVNVFDSEGLVYDGMLRSLSEPKVIPKTKDTFHIEYRLGHYLLGYFVATRLPDKVVIRTFLFLTMQGTPEAKLLRQKPGLQRPDIEHLDLDRLDTFLYSDLTNDPALRSLLEECGCGHLLDLTPDKLRDKCIPGKAAQVREYLQMDQAAVAFTLPQDSSRVLVGV